MKLIDLDPRWIAYDGQKLGVSFDCPHCKTQRLSVPFQHAGLELIDATHILAVSPDAKIWTETNPEADSFENLTLYPSIDCSSSGHWHGHVVNGEIV